MPNSVKISELVYNKYVSLCLPSPNPPTLLAVCLSSSQLTNITGQRKQHKQDTTAGGGINCVGERDAKNKVK